MLKLFQKQTWPMQELMIENRQMVKDLEVARKQIEKI